jgi:hypothetical protein
VRVDALPTNLSSFLALRDRLGKTPEGGAVLFVLAAHLYVQDEDLGIQAFAITMHRKKLVKTGGGYKGWEPVPGFLTWVRRLKKQPYGPASYIVGTTPENGYTIPAGPLVFRSFENRYSRSSDGSVRVFLHCSGADSPRAYTMSRNSRGIWKVSGGESNIYLGMKPPVAGAVGTNGPGALDDGDDL